MKTTETNDYFCASQEPSQTDEKSDFTLFYIDDFTRYKTSSKRDKFSFVVSTVESHKRKVFCTSNVLQYEYNDCEISIFFNEVMYRYIYYVSSADFG